MRIGRGLATTFLCFLLTRRLSPLRSARRPEQKRSLPHTWERKVSPRRLPQCPRFRFPSARPTHSLVLQSTASGSGNRWGTSPRPRMSTPLGCDRSSIELSERRRMDRYRWKESIAVGSRNHGSCAEDEQNGEDAVDEAICMEFPLALKAYGRIFFTRAIPAVLRWDSHLSRTAQRIAEMKVNLATP